jgi:imidazolonepropionase-like amidohydrolase
MRILRVGLLCSSLASTAAILSGQARPTTLVFVGARLVDGTGAVPVERSVLLVEGDRIRSIATMSEPGTIPADAERIDARGKTILPGFVNAHGHVADKSGLKAGPEFYTRDNLERQLRLYAQYGVTTVFSLGGDGPEGVALRNEPPVGRARLFIAGPIVTGTTAATATRQVDVAAAMKVDWIKFRVDDNLGTTPKMPRDAWLAALQRAHEHNLPVAAHLFYLADAKDLLRAGVDLIAHSIRDQPVDDEFIQLVKAHETCVVPTLTREVSTFVYESDAPFFSDEFFLRHADPKVIQQLKDPARQAQMRKSASAQKYKEALKVAMQNLKTLEDAGVRVAMGTDTGPPARFQGFFEHMELELMVKAGLTPMQAIVAATGDAARCMKKADTLGVIKPGASADFAIYRDDPTKDIRATRSLESVYVAGARIPEAAPPGR